MSRESKRNKAGWLIEYDGVKVERIDALPPASRRLAAVNLKGCNGSGKSTVPMYMIKSESVEHLVFLTLSPEDTAPVATYCKSYDTVILGRYLTMCGGCDSLGDTQIVKKLLARLWRKDVHLLYEGVIVGDIYSTFYSLMKAFNDVYERDISFCFVGTRFGECLRRIQRRNGGKEINTEMVKAKYKNSVSHLKQYLAAGDVKCTVLNTTGTRQETFEEFLGLYPIFNPMF